MDWFIIVKHGGYIGFDMTPHPEDARNTVRTAEQDGEFMLVPVPAPRYAAKADPYGYYRMPFAEADSIRLLPSNRLPIYLGFDAQQPELL